MVKSYNKTGDISASKYSKGGGRPSFQEMVKLRLKGNTEHRSFTEKTVKAFSR